jgi:fructokinase
MTLWAGIEAGGTKFVCAVGTGPDDIRVETSIPTTSPQETLARSLAFFREQEQQVGKLTALGIASFGPVDPNPASATFGYITTTPKAGWGHTDFGCALSRALGLPLGFDTDVNGAALGEQRWGAARGLDTFVYFTVGTGIGGGGMANGALLHGLVHPEMGHLLIAHDKERDPFAGACPYHGDCWEGLACGPAIEQRWGRRGETLPADHPAWALEAHYLALGLVNVIVTLSPQRIIMGGGIMQQAQIFPMMRREVQRLLNGYVQAPAIISDIDSYIVPPALGKRAGVLGALALAERAGQQADAIPRAIHDS